MTCTRACRIGRGGGFQDVVDIRVRPRTATPGPCRARRRVVAGDQTYVNRSVATTALVPPALTTRKSLTPVPGGVTAVHRVADGQDTDRMATVPTLIAITPVRFRPVIV